METVSRPYQAIKFTFLLPKTFHRHDECNPWKLNVKMEDAIDDWLSSTKIIFIDVPNYKGWNVYQHLDSSAFFGIEVKIPWLSSRPSSDPDRILAMGDYRKRCSVIESIDTIFKSLGLDELGCGIHIEYSHGEFITFKKEGEIHE